MEAVAKLKNARNAPRKMRLSADLIRGKRVNEALNILKFNHKMNSSHLEKLVLSAISNWQQKNEGVRLEDADLYIKTIAVDEGGMLKRLQPAAQGRANRIRKRFSHVTVVVDSHEEVEHLVQAEESEGAEETTETEKES